MATFFKRRSKKRLFKLPIAILIFALLAAGGGIAYKAMALTGINVTAPIAGDYWSGTQEITWDADCATISNVNIFWGYGGTVGSPTQQTLIASGVNCNAYSYSWDTTLANFDGDEFVIRIEDASITSTFDYSDGFFTIDNTDPSVDTSTLTSPNGNEFWAGGSSQTITWTSGDITDANLKTNPISLYYTTDGSSWISIAGAENLINSGTYSWTVPTIDSEIVKVKIIATDLAGNTASDVSDMDFTIDSIKPSFASVGVTDTDTDTFYKAGDTISFTVDLGEADLIVTADLTVFDTALSPSFVLSHTTNGIYTGTTGSLSDGSIIEGINTAVTMTATDQAGNVETDNSLELTIDKTSPGVVISFFGGVNQTNANPIPIIITFNEEMVGFEVGDIDVVNGTAGNFITSDNVVFTADITGMADGAVTVDIVAGVATDLAGNGNIASNNFSIIYDGTAPTFNVSDDAEIIWVDSDVVTFTVDHTVAGAGSGAMHNYKFVSDATCDGSVSFLTNSFSYTPAGDTITVNSELQNGKYLCLVAMDLAGNFGYKSVGPFMIDTVPAIITITEDVAGVYVQSDDVIFTVDYTTSGAGDTEYVLTGGTCVVGDFYDGNSNNIGTDYTSGATLTFNDEADDGKFVCLRARDGKGDEGSEVYTYAVTGQLMIDRTDPIVAIDTVTTPTNVDTQEITGTFTEAHISEIAVKGVVANIENDTYSATVSLTEGDNPIIVVATDIAGNTGEATASISLDTTDPIMQLITPVNNSYHNGDVVLIYDFEDVNLDYLELDIHKSNGVITQVTLPADNLEIQSMASLFPSYGVKSASYNETEQKWTIIIDTTDDFWPNGETKFYVEVGDSVGNQWKDMVNDPWFRTYYFDNEQPTGTVSVGTLTIFDEDLIQEVTITYNEVMDTTINPVIGFSQSLGVWSSNNDDSWSEDKRVYTESFTITDANEETTGVTVSSSGAKDVAGNVEDTSVSATFNIDTENPTPTVVVLVNPINKTNLIQTVAVTYNESMNTGTEPVIVLTGNNWGSQTGSWIGDVYTATFLHNGTEEEIFNAVASVSGAEDVIGNDGVGGVSVGFVIDTKAPTVAITSTEVDPANSSPFQITITFDEEVSGFEVEDINVINGAAGNLQPVITAPVTTNQIWTVDITPTTDGVVTVNILADKATDSAENGNIASNEFSITYDETAPTLTEITPVPVFNNISTPSYTFHSTEAGAVTYTGACGNGDISVAVLGDNLATFSALADGTYSDCVITVTDTANNPGNITVNEFVIDTQAPIITNLIPEDDFIDTNTPTISATLTDENSGIDENTIIVKVDGNTVPHSYDDNVVSYTPITGLTDGSHTVTIDVDDNAGNSAIQAVTTFIVDTTDPTITIDPVDTPTNQATQIMTGTYVEENLDMIEVDGVDATVNETTKTYTVEISLTEGDNTITATITDLAENTGSAITNIVLDTQAPTVDAGADKIANAEFTQDAAVTDGGTGIASYLWTNESTGVGTIIFGSADAEDTTIFATNGTYTIRLTVVDNAENSAFDEMTLIWDDQAPTVEITSPLTGTKVNGNAVITFTNTEPNNPQCSIDDTNWVDCVSGTTKLSDITGFSGLGEVAFALYLEDTDTAGNTGTDSEAGIIKDTVIPTITDISSDKVNGSYTVGENIDIDVTFSENVTSTGDVTVTLNTGGTCTIPEITTAVDTATCEYYTVVTGENTADLDATVSGTIIDEAGNTMIDFIPDEGKTLAENKNIIIDTIAPTLYTVGIDQDYINNDNKDALSFTFENAEVGATYNYSINDIQGVGTAITGEGIVDSIVDQITGINVSTLNDGELVLFVYLTDLAGNQGFEMMDAVIKDTTAPEITNQSPIGIVNYTNPTISADFSEDVSGVDISGVTIQVTGGSINFDESYFTVTELGITSNTSGVNLDKNTTYAVVIDGLKDNFGNIADEKSWSFTISSNATGEDTISPTATQFPADNSTNIAVTVNPYIDFSEAMNETSLDGNVRLKTYVGSSIVVASYSITINGDGTTRVTIIPDDNLGNNIQYYFYIDNDVQDLAGNNIEEDSWYAGQKDSHEFTTIAEDVPVTTYDIPLNAGWNLISLPLIPTNSAIDAVLGNASSSAEIVWSYEYDENGENPNWYFYNPSNTTGNTLTTMEDGKGYWIYMNTAGNLIGNGSETPEGGGSPTNYELVEDDWNLIGFKSTENMNAGDYVRDYTNKTLNSNSILWDYKNGSYSSSPLHSSDDMESRYGYWLLIQ